MTGIDREDAELSDAKSPKIYVTRKGGMYVKAEELLRRKKVRARIRAMSKLAAKRKPLSRNERDSE